MPFLHSLRSRPDQPSFSTLGVKFGRRKLRWAVVGGAFLSGLGSAAAFAAGAKSLGLVCALGGLAAMLNPAPKNVLSEQFERLVGYEAGIFDSWDGVFPDGSPFSKAGRKLVIDMAARARLHFGRLMDTPADRLVLERWIGRQFVEAAMAKPQVAVDGVGQTIPEGWEAASKDETPNPPRSKSSGVSGVRDIDYVWMRKLVPYVIASFYTPTVDDINGELLASSGVASALRAGLSDARR